MPAPVSPITAPGLLWCEGPDDFAFFLSLLGDLGIGQDVVYVEKLNGRPELHDYLNGLPVRDRRQRLKALGIVCDADVDSGPMAFRRVRDDLRNTGYRTPTAPASFARGALGGGPLLHVGVFIMPNNQSPGALEDLCLDAIGADPSLSCVDEFLQCVSSRGAIVWRTPDASKARLNAWLASRRDPTLLLGYAMNAGLIDRNSPAFAPIRTFLTQLADAAGRDG